VRRLLRDNPDIGGAVAFFASPPIVFLTIGENVDSWLAVSAAIGLMFVIDALFRLIVEG
jgi:hypothetical protein